MAADPIAQIKRMLEIAARNTTNVNEAANAAALAQEMMLKHNIAMADLEMAGQADAEEIVGEVLDDAGGAQRRITWHGAMTSALCRAFDCKAVWFGNNMTVFGKTSNVQTVKYMFHYLTNEIERLVVVARNKNTILPGKTGSNSFKLGAVSAISARLQENKASTEAAFKTTNANAMVRIDKDREAVEAFFNQKVGKTTTLSTKVNTSASSYNAGYEAGGKISLGGGKGIGTGYKQLGC